MDYGFYQDQDLFATQKHLLRHWHIDGVDFACLVIDGIRILHKEKYEHTLVAN